MPNQEQCRKIAEIIKKLGDDKSSELNKQKWNMSSFVAYKENNKISFVVEIDFENEKIKIVPEESPNELINIISEISNDSWKCGIISLSKENEVTAYFGEEIPK